MKTLTFTGFLLFFISNAILSQIPGELDLTFGGGVGVGSEGMMGSWENDISFINVSCTAA